MNINEATFCSLCLPHAPSRQGGASPMAMGPSQLGRQGSGWPQCWSEGGVPGGGITVSSFRGQLQGHSCAHAEWAP